MRKFEEIMAAIAMRLCAALVFGSLFLILGVVIYKGIGSMNLDMITRSPQGGYYLGKEGGVLNAIVGSLLMTIAATIIAFMASLPVVLYINVYARKGSRLTHLVRLAFDLLWGIPSIVYGAFGFTIMLFLGLSASLLAGTITVSLLMLPIMARSMDEVISLVPRELLEASYSLGATRIETALRVITRQTVPGILSAVLIAFGRGIGDAASVLFTAGFSDSIPFSPMQPAATLPLAIFFQLGTPFPEVQGRAYASAFILMAIILLISLAARFLSVKFRKHIIT